MGVRTRRVS